MFTMPDDLDTIIAKGSYLDSRDLQERFDELQSQAGEVSEGLSADELDEYAELHAICEEGDSTFEDWQFGVSLIPDSDFEDHARELADELGYGTNNEQWPYTCIDWEHAARELQMDYSIINIRGTDYWGR